jgi:hypothetical protein
MEEMAMLRRVSIAGLGLVVVLMLSALTTASASAAPPLGCYLVETKLTGNYMKNVGGKCTEKLSVLTSEWVEATPVKHLEKTLWCAEVDTPAENKTGTFEDSACSKPKANGNFIKILVELPSILFLEGTKEGELKGESKTANTEYATVSGSKLAAQGYLIQVFITEDMQKLGKADLLFTNVKEPLKGTACKTEGDELGLVLIPNAEWHLVLSPAGNFRILVLVPEFTMTCGTLKLKFKGSVLTSVEPFGKEVLETEEFSGALLCTFKEGKNTGKAELTEYLNEEGTTAKAKLEANFGLGFEEGCEQIEGKIKLKPTKMLEVMES